AEHVQRRRVRITRRRRRPHHVLVLEPAHARERLHGTLHVKRVRKRVLATMRARTPLRSSTATTTTATLLATAGHQRLFEISARVGLRVDAHFLEQRTQRLLTLLLLDALLLTLAGRVLHVLPR